MMNTTEPLAQRTEDQVPACVTMPAAEILETPEAYLLLLDMPGAPKESITLAVTEDGLVVEAMVAPRPAENARMLLQEIRTTAYRRAFALGKGIDANAIEAGCAEGVLTVTLRKSAKVQHREITITS